MRQDEREDVASSGPSRRRVLAALGATATAGFAATGAVTGGDSLGAGDDDLAGLQLDDDGDDSCSWDRTDDSNLPFSTDGYGGWGGHEFHDTGSGTDHVPVVFAHGNSRDACDFLDHAEFLLDREFAGDELWAITFGREGSTHGEMRAQLESFVGNVLTETGADRVQLVGHSLGVTGLRYWLDGLEEYPDRYDRVETVVGIAGANHGTWTCGPGCVAGPGTTRVCEFVSHACADTPGAPLYELNDPDETPFDDEIDYYTIRGRYDEFFVGRPESPFLDCAENVTLETDHDGVRTSEATRRLLDEWLSVGG
jgi:triacylglycerol lipase